MTKHQDEPSAVPGADTESGFERWSRRKLAARVESQQAAPTADTQASAQAANTLTDADMPPVESLDEDCNVSGFFSSTVSDELRRLALRKLFHLPKFNVCDGLDDYAEDYTTFEPLGEVITADMRHRLERAAERARETLNEEQPRHEAEAAEPAVAAETAQQDEPAKPLVEGEQHERS